MNLFQDSRLNYLIAKNEIEHVVLVEMPGFDRESLDITFTDFNLRIGATKKTQLSIRNGLDDNPNNYSILKSDIVYGIFDKVIRLPCKVEDEEKVDISYKDGLLTIKLKH